MQPSKTIRRYTKKKRDSEVVWGEKQEVVVKNNQEIIKEEAEAV